MLEWYKGKYWTLPQKKMYLDTDRCYYRNYRVGRKWFRFHNLDTKKPTNIFIASDVFVYCCYNNYLGSLYATLEDALVDLKLKKGMGAFINSYIQSDTIMFPVSLLYRTKTDTCQTLLSVSNKFVNSIGTQIEVDPDTLYAKFTDLSTLRNYNVQVTCMNGDIWSSDRNTVNTFNPYTNSGYFYMECFEDFVEKLVSNDERMSLLTEWKVVSSEIVGGLPTLELKGESKDSD